MSFKRSVFFTFLVQLAIVGMDRLSGFIVLKLVEQRVRSEHAGWTADAIAHEVAAIKGVLDQLSILPYVLMALANLGFATSTVYLLRKGRFTVREAGETTSFLAIVWGSFLAAGAFGFTYWVGTPEHPAPRISLLLPVVILVPILLTTSYFNSIQLATGRIRDFNLVHLCSSLPFLPLFLLLFLGLRLGPIESGVYSRVLMLLCACFLALRLVRDLVVWRPRLHRAFLREGLLYGWRANINSTLTYLNHRLDIFLISFWFLAADSELRKAEVAFYSLAVTFAELIWHLPEATRDLFFSRVAGQSEEEARRFTPIVCRNMLLICALGALGVCLFVDPVMKLVFPQLWPDSWAPIVMPCLHWLLPGTLAFTVSKVLQTDLVARGRINLTVVASTLVLVVTTVLDYLLIPTLGARGAAIGSTVAYLAGTLFTLVAYIRTAPVRWFTCLIPHWEDFEHYRQGFRRVVRGRSLGGAVKGVQP
jgi:O-antigen/teichoic acid export membrane protein